MIDVPASVPAVMSLPATEDQSMLMSEALFVYITKLPVVWTYGGFFMPGTTSETAVSAFTAVPSVMVRIWLSLSPAAVAPVLPVTSGVAGST